MKLREPDSGELVLDSLDVLKLSRVLTLRDVSGDDDELRRLADELGTTPDELLAAGLPLVEELEIRYLERYPRAASKND